MPLQILDAGAVDRTITELRIIDAGGTDRVIQELRCLDASGTDRVIYTNASPLTVSVAPGSVSGATSGTGTATTDPATATPSGGTAPYTYAWSVLSYSAGVAPTADSPGLATSNFTQTGIAPGEVCSATFRCTVTDANGNTGSDECFAIWTDISGGFFP